MISPSAHRWRAQLRPSPSLWPAGLLSRGPAEAGPSTFSIKRWLLAALAAVVAPKCVLCIAGYLAAGGAAVELCGAIEPESHVGAFLAAIAGCVAVGVLSFRVLWERACSRLRVGTVASKPAPTLAKSAAGESAPPPAVR